MQRRCWVAIEPGKRLPCRLSDRTLSEIEVTDLRRMRYSRCVGLSRGFYSPFGRSTFGGLRIGIGGRNPKPFIIRPRRRPRSSRSSLTLTQWDTHTHRVQPVVTNAVWPSSSD